MWWPALAARLASASDAALEGYGDNCASALRAAAISIKGLSKQIEK